MTENGLYVIYRAIQEGRPVLDLRAPQRVNEQHPARQPTTLST
jgi:hypothetical protein